MGLFDPTSLQFDISEITKMRTKLQDTSAELAEFVKTLTEAYEKLKESWKTPAGEKFIQTVDVDWLAQAEKYIKVINIIDELLSEAETSYVEVEEAANELTF